MYTRMKLIPSKSNLFSMNLMPSAGFLTEYVRGAPLSACAACGNYAANYIIQRFGVVLPPGPPTFSRWQPNDKHAAANGTGI